MLIPIDSISPDTSTQARHDTDPGVVEDYASAMRDGATFPPVMLFRDTTGSLRVGDGFHRVAAAQLAGLSSIEAEVRDGGAREALEHSIQSNARHGLRFSNRDKRRAVGLMLDDPEWSLLSDREIARRCGVSQPFVGKVRAEWGDNGYQPSPDLSPEDRAAMAEAENVIRACADEARTGVGAFLDVKARLSADQYRAWLDQELGPDWMDILDDFAAVLGSPEDQAKIRAAYPGPMIGDLPVGSLDPALAYQGWGRRGTLAKVFPSRSSGRWFVSVFDIDGGEVVGFKRPILEDFIPIAIHVSGFVCGSDPEWTTEPCEPALSNSDFEPEPTAV